MEGTVELETFPTVGHKILVRCAPPALPSRTRNALPCVARGGMHERLSERLRCGTGSTRRRRLAPSPGPRCRRPSTGPRRRRSWCSAPARSPRRCGSTPARSGRCRKRSSGTTAGGRCIPALSRSAQRHSFFSRAPYETLQTMLAGNAGGGSGKRGWSAGDRRARRGGCWPSPGDRYDPSQAPAQDSIGKVEAHG